MADAPAGPFASRSSSTSPGPSLRQPPSTSSAAAAPPRATPKQEAHRRSSPALDLGATSEANRYTRDTGEWLGSARKPSRERAAAVGLSQPQEPSKRHKRRQVYLADAQYGKWLLLHPDQHCDCVLSPIIGLALAQGGKIIMEEQSGRSGHRNETLLLPPRPPGSEHDLSVHWYEKGRQC